MAVSPVLPLITEDYQISYTRAGLLVGIVMIINASLCLPGGFIVGRLGLRLSYTIGWFMMGLLTLSALSPGFYGLLALRTVYGLGMAVMLPATGSLIMHWFRPKERFIMTSLHTASVSTGFVVAVSTAAPLADLLGWQRVLGLFGGVGLAGAWAWSFLGRNSADVGGVANSLKLGEVWDVVRSRTVFLVGLANAACFAQYIALSGWLPTFYVETRDMSPTEAGFLTSLLPFLGIFGVILGGQFQVDPIIRTAVRLK